MFSSRPFFNSLKDFLTLLLPSTRICCMDDIITRSQSVRRPFSARTHARVRDSRSKIARETSEFPYTRLCVRRTERYNLCPPQANKIQIQPRRALWTRHSSTYWIGANNHDRCGEAYQNFQPVHGEQLCTPGYPVRATMRSDSFPGNRGSGRRRDDRRTGGKEAKSQDRAAIKERANGAEAGRVGIVTSALPDRSSASPGVALA